MYVLIPPPLINLCHCQHCLRLSVKAQESCPGPLRTRVRLSLYTCRAPWTSWVFVWVNLWCLHDIQRGQLPPKTLTALCSARQHSVWHMVNTRLLTFERFLHRKKWKQDGFPPFSVDRHHTGSTPHAGSLSSSAGPLWKIQDSCKKHTLR